MNTLNANADVNRQEAVEVVISELERSLAVMEANYRKAVSNLETLRECVDKDDLTRLLSRGAFLRKLRNLLTESKERGIEVNLFMIDVDHFKKVNDGYGHQTGDVVLERISELIRGFVRSTDLAGRYGGEEIIVAVQADRLEACQIAERIREAVERHTMRSSSSDSEFQVTLSMGIASTREFAFEVNDLIARADAALYRAKRSGRNRVVIASRHDDLVAEEAA